MSYIEDAQQQCINVYVECPRQEQIPFHPLLILSSEPDIIQSSAIKSRFIDSRTTPDDLHAHIQTGQKLAPQKLGPANAVALHLLQAVPDLGLEKFYYRISHRLNISSTNMMSNSNKLCHCRPGCVTLCNDPTTMISSSSGTSPYFGASPRSLVLDSSSGKPRSPGPNQSDLKLPDIRLH